MNVDFSGNIPSTKGVQGFRSILPQNVALDELWTRLQAIRTYPEQVRAYLTALKNRKQVTGYGDLSKEARQEWPILEDAFTSESSRKRILELSHWRESCPRLSNFTADERSLQTAIVVHSYGEELLRSHHYMDGGLIMAQPSLAEMIATAAATNEPRFTSESVPKLGGVDPLGLRQINFDLMDQVFPGLNNVARSAMRNTNARKWLAAALPLTAGPTELMKEIEDSLAVLSSPDLPRTIIRGIAFCLAESPEQENHFERPDRLPLFRARREATARERGATTDFARHVFESWVLAQHVYWSVGRGLADARAQGKTLLRLKVVLDEGGWALAPGVSRGPRPLPTQDRLQTIVSLAEECGLRGYA